jgi:hypothetical protein
LSILGGAFASRHAVVRPVRSYEPLRDLDRLMDRIAALRDRGQVVSDNLLAIEFLALLGPFAGGTGCRR